MLTSKDKELIWECVQLYTLVDKEGIFTLIELVERATTDKIPGAFVECGVWRGGSVMAMLLVLNLLADQNRQIYLYDTFEGMSKPTEHDVKIDRDGVSFPAEVKYNRMNGDWARAPIEDVMYNIEGTAYPLINVTYVKGKVEDTLKDGFEEEIALLRLDTDFYESTKIELEMLYPKLNAGGVLIIDDYHSWQGSRKAVDEYFGQQEWKRSNRNGVWRVK